MITWRLDRYISRPTYRQGDTDGDGRADSIIRIKWRLLDYGSASRAPALPIDAANTSTSAGVIAASWAAVPNGAG